MRITLEDGPSFTFVIRAETGESRPVEHDADFAPIAQSFGWPGKDDGSAEAIWEAYAFLDQHVGDMADDPGYF